MKVIQGRCRVHSLDIYVFITLVAFIYIYYVHFSVKEINKAFPIIIYNMITYLVVDFIAHCFIPTGRIICNKLKFCVYVAFRPYPNSENFYLMNT